MHIDLSTLRLDGGTQPRAQIDETIVSEYANAMRNGATFPPVIVFMDGVDNWLADGFHRFHAARAAGLAQLPATINTGTRRDAILYSVSANAAHGLRRTNEDKRRAVMTLLNDAEWATWSDREIARRCGVHHDLPALLRKTILADSASIKTERSFIHHKTGEVSAMNTANIGKRVDSLGRTISLRDGYAPREDRIEQISSLAAEGHTSEQIGDVIGIDPGTVRKIANSAGLTLPDKAIGRVRKVDNYRVISETVDRLEASAASLRAIGVSYEGITKDQAKEWLSSLGPSLRVYISLRNNLKELAK